ncbi:MAG: histidine tRNA synthetase [Terrestrivirus sp.]|uniref:histidine--tRNA ligase n=1 Tax=Terrestrivirus sp. TaxID=2487775 RepID=A0A3G4ZNL5_9VIRU|nr:MAG: histidine tRNA synthetase [Terrestrivirus sp.]
MIRTATGTRDLYNIDVKLRSHIFDVSKKCFECRNAKQLETPIFELYDTVKNIYGEEFNKLVYKLKDESDELILRYDLTVPFARYVGVNGLQLFRRYQIGKVYRSDNPQISKGRFREFYQCDFDIAGNDGETNIFDMEICDLAVDVITRLIGHNFIIKFNHRTIITDYLTKLNIPPDMFNSVTTSIDKLDKKTIDEIKQELTNKFANYDNNNNNDDMNNIVDGIIEFIKNISSFNENNNSWEDRLKYLYEQQFITEDTYHMFFKIMTQLSAMQIDKYFSFEPLLARGLDYYTGIIFEGYYYDKNVMESAICGGGRYDNLIEKFSNHGKIPSVGFSLGVERIVTILEIIEKDFIKQLNELNNPEVYICTIGQNMVNQRIRLASLFRKKGVNCIMSHSENPKMGHQMADVFDNNIKFMIVVGDKELKNNQLTIKKISTKEQFTLDFNDAINHILNEL